MHIGIDLGIFAIFCVCMAWVLILVYQYIGIGIAWALQGAAISTEVTGSQVASGTRNASSGGPTPPFVGPLTDTNQCLHQVKTTTTTKTATTKPTTMMTIAEASLVPPHPLENSLLVQTISLEILAEPKISSLACLQRLSPCHSYLDSPSYLIFTL